MRRSFAQALGLIFVALAFQALPALASATPDRGPSLAHNVSAGDLLARFHAWLGNIWPENGCGIDPNGGSCVVPPPGNQSLGSSPAARSTSSEPAATH
jgi:hypothetical protein